MGKWHLPERQTEAEVRIQRSIFQGDSLSPQLFVKAIMSQSYILKNASEATHLQNRKIKPPRNMDDIKIFAKNEKKQQTNKKKQTGNLDTDN